jgi:hypothetical protein
MRKLFTIVLIIIAVVIIGAIYLYQSNPNSLLPRYSVEFYEIEGFIGSAPASALYTQAELDALKPEWWNDDAIEVYGELASVNFDTHFVANHGAAGSGCNTLFEPILIALNENTLNYNIEITEIGTCEPGRTQRAPIAIPIEYKDYDIIFTSEVVSTDF